MEALVREIARLIFDMLEVQSERCAYCGGCVSVCALLS